MLQGLIPGREGGIFVPSQHAAHEFEDPLQTLIFPDVLHLLPQPEAACQIEAKAQASHH